MADDLFKAAVEYHRAQPPGKLTITPTKPMTTSRDLSLAYSPGVAGACLEIAREPAKVSELTTRANLVAVVTNGTAVLGLGTIGALAAKPVMEGKAVLFKKFSGIDVFDIEIDERDPKKFVETVAGLEATFGGINLEDIKAPECFEIESALRERMKIPVFHDDQHGTAIIVAAAMLNGLRLVGKDIGDVRLVVSGAGAAAIACLDLLVNLGMKADNITVTDIAGVVYEGRTEEMDPWKARYARATDARALSDVIDGADIFLGLSAGGVLKPEMVERMANAPLIFALANPTPEIFPEEAKAVRPDAIIATGRSDYPNQVNNALCFPYIFRGAMDVGATEINDAMKRACVRAIADLATAEVSDTVRSVYAGEPLRFGPDYLIPKPFDMRLVLKVAPAVAQAAMDSGVATRPIDDMNAYKERLRQFVFRSGAMMRPVFDHAQRDPKRVVYAEGDDDRVLGAVQQVVADGLAHPLLIGNRGAVEEQIERLGLRIRIGEDVELLDPDDAARAEEYATAYRDALAAKESVSPQQARERVQSNNTVVAALAVRLGHADAMLCGASGRYDHHLEHVLRLIGPAPGVRRCSALSALILPTDTLFICDTHVIPDPSADEVAQLAVLCADEVRRFGIAPRVALLSYSNFGSSGRDSARKMQDAARILKDLNPDFEVDGEMHADLALAEGIRQRLFPDSRLSGKANLLVMPNLDSANIGYNLLKVLGNGVGVGPILVGADKSAHIVDSAITERGLINMTAVSVVQAQYHAERAK
ncbi:MAG: NADP-dependent malic enzyme [Gammaproteobacteria bacterium]